MKIEILPLNEFENAQERVQLYNLIKRSEEDLQRRMPALELFTLFLQRSLTTGAFFAKTVASSYAVNDIETELQVQIKVSSTSDIHTVKNSLARELEIIKTELY